MAFVMIVSIVLVILYAFLILYYRFAWNDIPDYTYPAFNSNPSTFISVIIPARNEAANIRACLESMAKQTYPGNLFEVLVIDDHSTDGTAAIIHSFAAKKIKYISLKEYIGKGQINSYKKKAIEIGVQESKGKLIVTTDADCIAPENWLKTIAAFYEERNPAFIAAPVCINNNLNFGEIFQALDFMTLQGITGASVHKKMHTMCNGANLAYERSAFYEVNGFKGIDAIASGDDMLLMHKIYMLYPQRVLFLKSVDSIVQTAAQKSIVSFFNQRIRWASKADKYDDKRILPVLVIVYLLNVMLLIIPLLGCFINVRYSIFNVQCSLIKIWILLLIFKTAIELSFLFPVAGFFKKRSLLWLFPIMQPFHIIYTVAAGWLGKFGTYKWKDRKVK